MPLVNPKNTHTYLVQTGEPRHTLAEGIGCNFLISNQSALPDFGDATRWRQVMAALDDLRVGWMRVGVIPTTPTTPGSPSWDDKRQRWDFRHPHWRVVRKIGRWARERGVNLMFDAFVVPPSFKASHKGEAFFAHDPRDFARKLVLPVAEFFRREKLTTFRYLGLLNENIWGPGKEGFAAVKDFHGLYQAVRDTLDEAGIGPDELGLLGPSNLSSWEWPVADFFAAGLDPDPLWVGYDEHLYLYRFDWILDNHPDFMSLSELTERHLRRAARYAHLRGKPMFITELGNMYCGRLFWGERDFDGPYTHTSVLMDAELIVRAVNEGVDGFLRWAFSVRGDRDGRWSLLENTGDAMAPTPAAYPMYRLLMRAIRPRATVLASRVDGAEGAFRYVFSAAVKNPDGAACVLLINDFPGRNLNVGLELGAPFRGKKLFRAVCDQSRPGVALPPIAINKRGEGEMMLTPSSLTVLSTQPIV
jgi:hypothetical protein